MKKQNWQKQEMKDMRVLIDTNVIIDFVVKRNSFSDNAEKVIGLCMENNIQICIAAHTVTNLFYILRKHLTNENRRSILLMLCKMFTVVSIDANKLESALLNTNINDFEDCLQIECAKYFEAGFIVTRNVKDFAGSIVPAVEPSELIKKLSE